MKRDYASDAVKELGTYLTSEGSLEDKKRQIDSFHSKYISSKPLEDANKYVGKLLLRFFFGVNVLVVIIIIVFAILDVIHHINDAENRFIDGNVLGGLVTATIAQAVAFYIAFVKFINTKH